MTRRSVMLFLSSMRNFMKPHTSGYALGVSFIFVDVVVSNSETSQIPARILFYDTAPLRIVTLLKCICKMSLFTV